MLSISPERKKDYYRRHINIVVFDVPDPPNYGGVIDSYNKILSLNKEKVKVHLHCFLYGRATSEYLEKVCESVTYYKREMSLAYFFSKVPFIVRTRANIELLDNLKANDYPILFEGLHTTYYLDHEDLSKRTKLVRAHNIEHHYYFQLAKAERNILKKFYLLTESIKLRFWEKKLVYANYIMGISRKEAVYFIKYGKSLCLPPFHNSFEPLIKPGKGNYILYHGNLSVQENIKAVLFLIENVFSRISHNVIIAGRRPDIQILKAVDKFSNIELVSNPNEFEIEKLIKEAQINVLVTFQETGIKLKLLQSLFNGRYCIVNSMMVKNTNLEKLCLIADEPDEIIRLINDTFPKEFDENSVNERIDLLGEQYSNLSNVKTLCDLF